VWQLRRRLIVLAVVAGMLVAGCSAGRAAPSTSRAAAPPVAPSSSGATVVVAHSPASRWVIPAFPPAPVPVPITLPAGGAVPFLSRIPTTQPVAFLTIDDGYTKTAEAPRLIAAAHIPVTLFLTTNAVAENPAYFAPMQSNGAVIEAHTITHTELRGRSYAYQKHEICGSADRLGHWFRRRPVLFRPPFGTKDATTLRAARDCGIRAMFMWRETVDKGKVRYQDDVHRIQAGDIILMHFRPAFAKDFLAALRAIQRAGLTPALLEDYIPA
jgi:peptidoglycan/xylan/chitin deacetylase (PgdA/CDA1 family)